MRVLVCGGAGYIGSHMVRQLLAAGHEPVVFDNFSTGYPEAVNRAFAPSGKTPDLIEGDLLDKALLAQTLADRTFDAVMHFSAFTLIGESVQQPGKYYENNVSGTLNLLRAMRAAHVDTFVFSSSCAVYGIPEYMPIREETPFSPINPYGYSKLMDEIIAKDFTLAHGIKCMALRYFNAAGADPAGDLGEAHDPESHLIPNIINAVLGRGPELTVFGDDYPTPDGTCIRDYVHVSDLVRAHLSALEFLSQQHCGMFEAFNLGTGRGTSNLEVIQSVERISGKQVPYSFGPRRMGDAAVLYAHARKANTFLDWFPEYLHIDDIVRTAWTWHSGPGFHG